MSANLSSYDNVNEFLSFLWKSMSTTEGRGEDPFLNGNWDSKKLLVKLKVKKTEAGFTKLGKDMLKMNIDSLSQRYGDKKDYSYAERFKFNFAETSPTQSYKSLQSFLYQCNEGNIDKRPLFKKLKAFQGELASVIVSSSKEYENSRW